MKQHRNITHSLNTAELDKGNLKKNRVVTYLQKKIISGQMSNY